MTVEQSSAVVKWLPMHSALSVANFQVPLRGLQCSISADGEVPTGKIKAGMDAGMGGEVG